MLRHITFLLLYFFISTSVNTNNAYASHIQTKASQAVVFDFLSDMVLFTHNADEQIISSSMSHLMTLYVTFSYMKAGFVKMEDKYITSKEAWQKGGASIFLRTGQSVTVRDLINGIITISANDASITLAEGIAGSQENFVNEMNRIAQKLNLTKSHFTNVTGSPDKNQVMSAYDLITLAVRLFKDFPEYYHLFSKKDFKYNNIYQKSVNSLLNNTQVDGIAVGYSEVEGYGAIISAVREGRRVFILTNGLKTEEELLHEVEQLIDYYFNQFSNKTIFNQGNNVATITVSKGDVSSVDAIVNKDIVVLYPKGLYDNVKISILHDNTISAPIKKGQEIGEIHIQSPGLTKKVIPIYATNNVNKINYLQKIWYMLFPKTTKAHNN